MAGYPVVISGNTKEQVSPQLAGVVKSILPINGAAASGSRYINDSTPTVAETLAEMAHFTFDETDGVTKVKIKLSAPIGASVHEAAYLKVTINPGDDVVAATRLTNGVPEVFLVCLNDEVEIQSASVITDVYCIAALTTIATPVQGAASIYIMGE